MMARIHGAEVDGMTMREKARELLKGFRPHPNEARKTVITTDDEAGARAAELAQYVHKALCLSLPDDWVYDEIDTALRYLADGGDPEDYEPEPDVYNSQRLRWLSECSCAVDMVDMARDIYGPRDSILDDIGDGQALARQRIMEAVAAWLAEKMGAADDEDDEADN